MRPLLFIVVILGGMTGVATYQATGFGFKSPASPGSFIVYCLNAPKGEFLHMVLGVFLAKTYFIRSCNINYEINLCNF